MMFRGHLRFQKTGVSIALAMLVALLPGFQGNQARAMARRAYSGGGAKASLVPWALPKERVSREFADKVNMLIRLPLRSDGSRLKDEIHHELNPDLAIHNAILLEMRNTLPEDFLPGNSPEFKAIQTAVEAGKPMGGDSRTALAVKRILIQIEKSRLEAERVFEKKRERRAQEVIEHVKRFHIAPKALEAALEEIVQAALLRRLKDFEPSFEEAAHLQRFLSGFPSSSISEKGGDGGVILSRSGNRTSEDSIPSEKGKFVRKKNSVPSTKVPNPIFSSEAEIKKSWGGWIRPAALGLGLAAWAGLMISLFTGTPVSLEMVLGAGAALSLVIVGLPNENSSLRSVQRVQTIRKIKAKKKQKGEESSLKQASISPKREIFPDDPDRAVDIGEFYEGKEFINDEMRPHFYGRAQLLSLMAFVVLGAIQVLEVAAGLSIAKANLAFVYLGGLGGATMPFLASILRVSKRYRLRTVGGQAALGLLNFGAASWAMVAFQQGFSLTDLGQSPIALFVTSLVFGLTLALLTPFLRWNPRFEKHRWNDPAGKFSRGSVWLLAVIPVLFSVLAEPFPKAMGLGLAASLSGASLLALKWYLSPKASWREVVPPLLIGIGISVAWFFEFLGSLLNVLFEGLSALMWLMLGALILLGEILLRLMSVFLGAFVGR